MLFCNITKITLRCKNNAHSVKPQHVQTVYEQHCDCQINADEYFLPQTSRQRKKTTNITLDFTPKFLINLPFISGFLERKVLKPLRDHSLLNNSIPVILPELPIASASYQAKLAVEKHSRYELETIINQKKKIRPYIATLATTYLITYSQVTRTMILLTCLTSSIGVTC